LKATGPLFPAEGERWGVSCTSEKKKEKKKPQ
jgi:hypothetical protein